MTEEKRIRPAGNGTESGKQSVGDYLDNTRSAVINAAERELAGSLLGAPDPVVDGALALVNDGDLLDGTARAVVSAARRLRSAGRSVSVVLVADVLSREPEDLPDELRRLPISTLSELAADALLPQLAPQLAGIAAEGARRRDVASAAGRLLRLADIAELDLLRAAVADAAAAVARVGGGSGE